VTSVDAVPLDATGGRGATGEADAPGGGSSSGEAGSPRRWIEVRWVQNLAALALFSALSVALFGRGWLADPTHRVVGGASADAQAFLWFLAWWPHAVAHATFPFVTHDVWAPTGISLLWVTSVPLPSLALGAFTVTLGPVFAFGLMQLLEPALAAWTAYLLCRRVTGDGLAALAGGAFFGFGSYETAQLAATHPNLAMVFLVPLAGYLVARRIDGSLGRIPFVALLAVVLAAQFGISTEILATMAVAGFLACVAGIALADRAVRPVIARTALLALAAGGLAAVLVAPALYALARFPRPTKPVPSLHAVTDWSGIRAFAVPGHVSQFHGGILGLTPGPNGSYLGVAALGILVVVAVTRPRRRLGSWLLVTAVLILVLTLGPAVRVGSTTIWLPWHLFGALPLLRFAGIGRAVVYASLLVALALAVFAARGGSAPRRAARWSLVVLSILSVMPSLTSQIWSGSLPNPPFFAAGMYRGVLHRGDVVVVVANGKGNQMFWQAESGMWFRLAGGYLGATPPGYDRPTFAKRLAEGTVGIAKAGVIRRFAEANGVRAFLVVGSFDAERAAIEAAFGVSPTPVGGVAVYRLPPPGSG
jgi:hypothetical protein